MLSKQRRATIFVEAGVMVLLVYLAAIITNGYLDTKREVALDNHMTRAQLDSEGLYLADKFYTEFSGESCELKRKALLNAFEDIKEIGHDLTSYGELFLRENEHLPKAKQREYFLRELLLYKDVVGFNERCDKLVPVIYFFNSKSFTFDKTGAMVDHFTKKHPNTSLAFSFDIMFEAEPLLQLFKEQHNVDKSPYVLVGNTSLGVVTEATLFSAYQDYRGES